MRPKLIVQFSVVSSIVILFTMALFTVFNIASIRQAFLTSTANEISNLSEIVLRSTYPEFMENDMARVFDTLRDIGEQEGVEHIRLLDREGRVVFSTEEEEIGITVPRFMYPGCTVCHSKGGTREIAPTVKLTRRFKDSHGHKIVGIARPIYNVEECSSASCHPQSDLEPLLGVLDLGISLTTMDALIGNYRNNVIVQILFLVLCLFLCLTILTQKLINQPVKTLLHHTRAVARGNWTLIDAIPGDELGELAEAFNDMTMKLKTAREERDSWASTLESKVEERTAKLTQMQSVLIRSEKLASLGELVAGIAHELNNPLTGIMIHAPLIAEDPRLDEGLRKDCQTIINEAERCSKIVGDLLNFSRVSDPMKTWNCVNTTIKRTLGLVEHHPDFHDIRIVTEFCPDLPQILIDAGQIEQVLLNMLVNASQAMPEGGDLVIRTGYFKGKEVISIEISDNGMGISRANLEKIFDPFFTTKGHKGTGLGLSVSYGIIESHHGRIDVSSREEHGTTFIITLPVDSQDHGDPPNSAAVIG